MNNECNQLKKSRQQQTSFTVEINQRLAILIYSYSEQGLVGCIMSNPKREQNANPKREHGHRVLKSFLQNYSMIWNDGPSNVLHCISIAPKMIHTANFTQNKITE